MEFSNDIKCVILIVFSSLFVTYDYKTKDKSYSHFTRLSKEQLMKHFFYLLLFSLSFKQVLAQKIGFEKNNNTTATYSEIINFYQQLDAKYDQAKLITYGPTDFGQPLHLLVLSKDKQFDPKVIQQQNKRIILINNGIHPGEPEGIDASMILARDLLEKRKLPENVVIIIIPVYNIGGLHQRGLSRSNQNGPEEYGFRGNAKNYNLNRDFIKTDSKNSHSFQVIFNEWQPDVFMDTHSSNGADYQYIMTLIDSQRDKLYPEIGKLSDIITGELFARMKKSGYEMVPYVSFRRNTPESGLVSYMENPRFSTGYAALHHTLSYMPETHMLKPYHQRVASTYELLKHLIEVSNEKHQVIAAARKASREEIISRKDFVLSWKLDTTKFEEIDFKGYESGQKPSEVSGLPRLYYDRNKPYTKKVRYYNRYKPDVVVQKPVAYYIPQTWSKAIELLQLNGVELQRINNDTILNLEMYYVESFQPARASFEGHFPLSQIKLRTEKQAIKCYKGDYLAYTNQISNRYLIETLEPLGPDSYFYWNFFDAVLSKKEHFSAYVFEDLAAEMLAKNPELKKEFEAEKKVNEQLRNSAQAQLAWIHDRSPYAEKAAMRYPIGRYMGNE